MHPAAPWVAQCLMCLRFWAIVVGEHEFVAERRHSLSDWRDSCAGGRVRAAVASVCAR
jgi:hypothetical protein